MILLCYISVPVCRYISTYMNIHMYIHRHTYAHIVVVVQSPSHVWLFVAPWTAAHQASLSRLLSWSLPKFRFIASVMPSSHLILSCPLLLLSSIFPSIRDFSNESVLHIRWPKYWTVDKTLEMNDQCVEAVINKTTFIFGYTINRMVYHVKEKTPESPLGSKKIKPVNLKGG